MDRISWFQFVISIHVSAFTGTQHTVRSVLSNRSEQLGTVSSQLHDWLFPLTLIRQLVCSVLDISVFKQ